MFRLSLLAAIMAVAQAFAPASLPAGSVAHRTSAVSCMKMQAKSAAIPFLNRPPALDGKTSGDVGFDPLWVSSMLPGKGWFTFLLETEIKHGRVAMLAAAGAIAQDIELLASSPVQSGEVHKIVDKLMHMMTQYSSSFGNVETAPILNPAAIAAGKGAPQEAAAAVAVNAEVALYKAFKTIAAGKRLYALAAAQKEAEREAMEVDDMSNIWR